MSYSYANGKKMRKKTKVQQLQTENNMLRSLVQRLGRAGGVVSGALDQFGKEENWLAKEDEVEGVVTTDYTWHNETNPVEMVKQAHAAARALMGLTPIPEPSLNSEPEPSAEVSSDHPGDELPSATHEAAVVTA